MLSMVYIPEQTYYPDSVDSFSPDIMYPEYPFGKTEISVKPNGVYEQVRKLLAVSGYDKEHYGEKDWNPLGDGIISPGDTVLIKPNWVENKNRNKEAGLDCLVTNPSVVRAVVDYVVIALKGEGKIVIADAPMQACNIQSLFTTVGYDKLFEFYKKQGISIEVRDLRMYSVGEKYRGVIGEVHYTKDSEGSIRINLGKRSLHSSRDNKKPEYKVEDYTQKETASYHSAGKHIYNVSATVLKADVIINMPKPKTHRLAGITGAIKNFVGITYDKASLPHRVEGDKETGKGDAYKKRSIWKQYMSVLNEKRTVLAKSGHYNKAKVFDYLMKSCYAIGTITSKDKYRIGSWYGNDTIWRTAVDLNNIVLHCDKEGKYHEEPVRKVLSIGDMIISGEKEGPVGPSPKPLGILILSDNNLLFDFLVCHIMGFSDKKLPIFSSKDTLLIFGFERKNEMMNSVIASNNSTFNGKLNELRFPEEWKFEPHPCWKGFIEKDE